MSSSNISSQSAYMKMKKTELVDELKAAENLFLEKEEELITCQDELSRIIAEQAKTQASVPTLEAELEDVKADLESLQELVNSLQTENSEVKNQYDHARTQVDKLSTENARLTKKAVKTKKELSTAKEALAKQKKAKETVPTSTHSFRLDIYPQSEDTFQSRIEHLLSGERQPLDGLDVDTIVEFIGNYLQIEEKPVASRHEVPGLDSSVELESTPAAPVKRPEKEQNIPAEALEIIPFAEPQLSTKAIAQHGIFQQNTPFQLQVNIKPSADSQTESDSVRCKISFFAKNLDSSDTTLLAVINDELEASKEESIFTINAIGLPYGFYRIDTVTSYTTLEGAPLPATSMQEASFLQVV